MPQEAVMILVYIVIVFCVVAIPFALYKHFKEGSGEGSMYP